jgi:hypothetical protein
MKIKIGMNNMYNKLKRLALGFRAWLSKANNSLKNTAYIVAIVTLIITAVQASLARSELEVSRADLESRIRPYLSIESIGVNDTGEDLISIMVGINNFGEIPATSVQLGEILMGGEQIAWSSEPNEDYPAKNYTTEEGVTIIVREGLVVAPMYSDFPDDMIFFPQKLTAVEMLVSGSIWRSTITDGSIIDIGLTYSWGDRQYWYVATVMLSHGEWKVILERGD